MRFEIRGNIEATDAPKEYTTKRLSVGEVFDDSRDAQVVMSIRQRHSEVTIPQTMILRGEETSEE